VFHETVGRGDCEVMPGVGELKGYHADILVADPLLDLSPIRSWMESGM
jgi:hypothetical protein